MATIKQGEKDYLEEHSKEKVEFYKKYLDLYLTVLINAEFTKSINIYDIFCGVGIYDLDDSKGSPIVAMECIKNQLKQHSKNSYKKVRLLINDGDTKRVERAKNYIEKNYNNEFEFTHYNLLSEEIFKLTISKIQKTQPNETNLIFIDPHGYKHIYKKDITNIMEAGKSEILIFLPIHQMYRFMKPKDFENEHISSLPLRRFMTEFELEYDAKNSKEYISHVQKAFSFNEKYYTASYILESDRKNLYALFYITKNLKGLEKAIVTKWELDGLCGKGFEQKKAPSLFEELDKEEKNENCLDNWFKKIKVYLQSEKDNNEIYEFTLKNGFLLKHTNEVLKKLQTDNKLDFDRKIRKSSFYLNYDSHRDNDIRYKVKIIE